MKYKGSCHCGRVGFEVEGTIERALACNCSICERKGSLLWFVPHDQLRLLTPVANASTYTFNKGDRASLLLELRHASVCRRDGSERRANGGGEHPLSRRNRPRGHPGHRVRWAFALSRRARGR